MKGGYNISKFSNSIFPLKFFILFMLFIMVTTAIKSQKNNLINDKDNNNGLTEIRRFSTFFDYLKSHDIPDSVLMNLPTCELVKICLAYPEWPAISICKNFQEGYNMLRTVFSGFEALEKRSDAFDELYGIYKNMDPADISTAFNKGELIFKFTFIELLISQEKILSKLSSNQLLDLIKLTLNIYNKKCSLIDYYSNHGLSTTCLLTGRLLKKIDITFYLKIVSDLPEIERFVQEGEFCPDKLLMEKIINSAKYVINN